MKKIYKKKGKQKDRNISEEVEK